MKRSSSSAVVAALAALLAVPAFAAGPLLEKDVDVPRDTRIAVDLVWEKCTIIDVETHNAPDAKMVEGGEGARPEGHHVPSRALPLLEHGLGRPPRELRTVLLDEKGIVVGDADHTAGWTRARKTTRSASR